MYYVIFCKDWCSVVPQSWVDIENEIFQWPPKEVNKRTAIIKMSNPNDKWMVQKYRHIIGPYDDYITALKVEKSAVDVSTSDEKQIKALNQTNSTTGSKRKITKKRFFDEIDNESESYENETESDADTEPRHNKHVTKNPKHIPSPPSNYVCHKDTVAKNKTDVQKENIPPEQESIILGRDIELQPVIDDVQNITAIIQSAECHACCNAIRSNNNKILTKLNEILNLLGNSETKQIDAQKSNLLPEFQLSTIEEFLQFERNLTDQEIRKQFKNKIAKIGGKSHIIKTRNILKFTLNDTLCQKLSWTGRKGSMAVKDTTFANIIKDYVSNADQCTLNDVQFVIQEWLRHAGDRIRCIKK